MIKADTDKHARLVLNNLYRAMPASKKLEAVFSAYQTAKALAMAGLKDSFPNADEKHLWHLWAKRHLGDQVYETVYGAQPDE